MNSEKICAEHVQRRALVYVRQSTAEQLRHNPESRRRQYALADRARGLGWQDVEVVDEDLGRSGATSVGRSGFHRVVAAVCLGEIGAVFSLEASRLARNNRDWYQLLDFCAMKGTLIVDFDGVYDPRQLNDRLLLGLKGTMSEFELGLLRQRAHEALHQMALRGELYTSLPVGYVRDHDGRCGKDPDLRVEQAITSVFERFAQCGSVRQTLLWFRQEHILLPAVTYGPEGRRVVWRTPVYSSVHRILTNPIYAGAYVFGRTGSETRVVDQHQVQVHGRRRPQEEWTVLLPNHLPAYVPWETYERNQLQIRENANMKGRMVRGAVQRGQGLLSGLLRCRRCGRRLHVHYSGHGGRVVRYSCIGANINQGAATCIAFGGLGVDQAVEREVLRVLEPAAIEAALAVAERVPAEEDARRTALDLALRQARYEAERARRQYDQVEPEHRLVAAELERRWNAALDEVGALEGQLAQLPGPPPPLSETERHALWALAEDFPTVWRDPATDSRLKKRLLRVLIEEIAVDVSGDNAAVELVLRWAGGVHTSLRVLKRHTGQHGHSTDREVVDLVHDLAQVSRDDAIAAVLNRLGLRSGKGNTWTELRVRSLRAEHRIPVFRPDQPRDWLTLAEAAARLRVSTTSVRRLIRTGALPARQVVPSAPWVISPDHLGLEPVQEAVRAIHAGRRPPLPRHPAEQMLVPQDL